MGRVRCPYCEGGAKRSGKAKAGSQRWRCLECGATFTRAIDDTAKLQELFLSWLLSGKTQDELSASARTFRRKRARFWEVRPMPPVTGEVHRVASVDGMRMAKNARVLIACTGRSASSAGTSRDRGTRALGAR